MGQCIKYKQELSVASQLLSRTQKGYRNQQDIYDCYCGCRSLKDMLYFETIELKNKDIYYTLRDGYGLKMDLRKKATELNTRVMHFVADRLETIPSCVDCVWVCAEKEQAEQLYGGNNLYVVDFTRANWMVISDLGRDGLLVAFTQTQAGGVQVTPYLHRAKTKNNTYFTVGTGKKA